MGCVKKFGARKKTTYSPVIENLCRDLGGMNITQHAFAAMTKNDWLPLGGMIPIQIEIRPGTGSFQTGITANRRCRNKFVPLAEVLEPVIDNRPQALLVIGFASTTKRPAARSIALILRATIHRT